MDRVTIVFTHAYFLCVKCLLYTRAVTPKTQYSVPMLCVYDVFNFWFTPIAQTHVKPERERLF